MIFLNLINIHISTVFRTLTFSLDSYIQQAINSILKPITNCAVNIIMLFHLFFLLQMTYALF